ncbi:hypothetical protein SCHPADRAFT_709984 [Schizopora paradoxa]|uniref:Uncharacterized protein n=1 Tax=Schizopora paradoxa TaxID=27342 RepID=A0A0H2R251_9AGAM|nr:hypothetical protein SCHPADRAFT_709984 [Schizopora paradoxa]
MAPVLLLLLFPRIRTCFLRRHRHTASLFTHHPLHRCRHHPRPRHSCSWFAPSVLILLYIVPIFLFSKKKWKEVILGYYVINELNMLALWDYLFGRARISFASSLAVRPRIGTASSSSSPITTQFILRRLYTIRLLVKHPPRSPRPSGRLSSLKVASSLSNAFAVLPRRRSTLRRSTSFLLPTSTSSIAMALARALWAPHSSVSESAGSPSTTGVDVEGLFKLPSEAYFPHHCIPSYVLRVFRVRVRALWHVMHRRDWESRRFIRLSQRARLDSTRLVEDPATAMGFNIWGPFRFEFEVFAGTGRTIRKGTVWTCRCGVGSLKDWRPRIIVIVTLGSVFTHTTKFKPS